MNVWKDCQAVEQVAGKLSGALVFRDTRVPVAALFENLKSEATVEEFLQWFPGVERFQVEDVLAFASAQAHKMP
ncbi:MAG: DUF433 domain-containing protein [Pirellulales bacterium]|nr:DUF433 domain-containing protein [Pirellulales bacterium]